MRQLPQHEQHYPDRLLPHRLEEYVLDNGRPPTQNRAFARKVTGPQVLDAVVAAQKRLGLANIDPRYYVSTCFHEAGCANEWDTEVASLSCPPGFVSVGAFQIGKEEAERYVFKLEDMLDLGKSAECMVQLAEYNRRQIRIAAKLINNDPDPDYTDATGHVWKGGTVRAYLAVAHNHGNGYTQKTIVTYGLDWEAFKKRNPVDNIVAHGYGEDCVTGGYYWPQIETPNNQTTVYSDHSVDFGVRALRIGMSGEDVRELQRHLKVVTDGSFGPKTDAEVRAFQQAHGMTVDGVVGATTVAALLAST